MWNMTISRGNARQLRTKMKLPAFCSMAIGASTAPSTRYAIATGAIEQRAVAAAMAAARALPVWETRAPVPAHTRAAFEQVAAQLRNRPLVLDAGCGTGRSSRFLARVLPHTDVLGVDRSAIRLQKGHNSHRDTATDAMFVRADLAHFWRLAVHAGWRTDYQFFFYPNPSPRRCQLKRRWYAHPSFPYVLALGGRIEVRASWAGYLHEFRAAYCALVAARGERPHVGRVHRVDEAGAGALLGEPVSNFEAKYFEAGQPTYRVVMDGRGGEARAKCPLAVEDDAAAARDAAGGQANK